MKRSEQLRLSLDVLASALELPEWFSAPQVEAALSRAKKSIPAPFSPRTGTDRLKNILYRGARSGFLESKRVYLPDSISRNKLMFYRFKEVDNMKIQRAATKKEIEAIRATGKGSLWVPLESVILNNQRLTLHCRVKSATPPGDMDPLEVPEYVKSADIAYIKLEFESVAVYEGGQYKALSGVD